MSDYREVFGRDAEAWREPLGALRITLNSRPLDLERARSECEALVKALNASEAQEALEIECGECGGDGGFDTYDGWTDLRVKCPRCHGWGRLLPPRHLEADSTKRPRDAYEDDRTGPHGGEWSMIARITVIDGTLTEYPIAEKVRGGWQNGATFYPDESVTAIHGPYVFIGGLLEYLGSLPPHIESIPVSHVRNTLASRPAWQDAQMSEPESMA